MSGTGQDSHLAGIVGANIRRARLERGWKQRELGRAVSERTSVQQISDWERGAPKPSDVSLMRLSEVLGYPIAWFYTEHDNETVAA